MVTTPPTSRHLIVCNRYQHGLGNRIRVVLGGRVLARAEGRSFHYVWPTGPKFGPRLTDLWDVDYRSLPLTVSKMLSLRYPYRDHSLSWIDNPTRKVRCWQVRTSHALELPDRAGSWQQELRTIVPIPLLSDRIHRFYERHLAGAAYVGVMVRTHTASHAQTLRASPIEWYVKRMKEIRADSPEVTFFISADVPSAGAYLRAQIGNCVMLDDKGGYNTVSGVQSSVADLYLLAGSGHLLGPHYSSFVEMAQYLAGNGLLLETSRTPGPEQVDFRVLGIAADPTLPFRRTQA